MPARRTAKLRGQFDVVLSEVPPEAVGPVVTEHLAVKGFCSVDAGLGADFLSKCLEDVQSLQEAEAFGSVNPLVVGGLLGPEGSARIAEPGASGSVDAELASACPTLFSLENTLDDVAFNLSPQADRLGTHFGGRTAMVIHEKADPDGEFPALTEAEASKWLNEFQRAAVMVIVFLGPNTGTLELKPHSIEDAHVHEVLASAGSMVLLRPDVLSQNFTCPGKAFSASSFLLTPPPSKRVIQDKRLSPAAQALDDWCFERLQDMKNAEEDGFWDPNMPRDWQHLMNHTYHKGALIAVRGAAIRVPAFMHAPTWFQVTTAGLDIVQEVPIMRMDIDGRWDPSPDCWKNYRFNTKHGGFMEGVDLFDPKLFTMNVQEAKVTDPHQRHILEVGYTALAEMGYKKSQLVNAACGTFVGCANLEWNNIDKGDVGAFGATGAALSITSGRFAFVLGLKGPAMTLDTDAASGLSATFCATEAVQRKGNAHPCEFAVAVAARVILDPMTWPHLCQQGFLSLSGRARSFDSSGDGWMYSDGIAALALRTLADEVDGQDVVKSENNIGIIAGGHMNSNGRAASLVAPGASSMQEAMAGAVSNASISPLDVDYVECQANGLVITDALEVGCLQRTHRAVQDAKQPLILGAVKSLFGNLNECAGISSITRIFYAIQYGFTTPNCHMGRSNPHVDLEDCSAISSNELIEFNSRTIYASCFATGFGGTNCNMIAWGEMKEIFLQPHVGEEKKEALMFWPGGGGDLDASVLPENKYTLVGSWSGWAEAQPMEDEGGGYFGYTVTLGENCWEQFQVWLDGDSTKVLHPGCVGAARESAVLGPDSEAGDSCWIIDGRKTQVSREDKGALALTEVTTTDYTGRPGDRYRVRLCVAGRWRSVHWENLDAGRNADGEPYRICGRYYVAGSWNAWQLQAMEEDERSPGVFHAEVRPGSFSGNFQIVRNQDWAQVIYPAVLNAGSGNPEVCGPDGDHEGSCWSLEARPGATFRISFQRTVDADGDVKLVTWS